MSKIKNLIILSILFVLSFMLVGCFSVDELDYIRFETQPKTVFLKDEGIELSVIVKLTSETSERAPYSLVYDKEGKTSQAISGFQLTGFDTTEVGTRIATLAYTYQGSTAKLFFNYTVVLEDVELDFAGGTGTENDPFIIANRQHMQNISKYYSSKKYYKVADFVETIDASNWTSVNVNGSFDGNGVTFKNLDRTLFGKATDSVQSVFKNFTIDDAYVTGGFHIGAVVNKVYDNILFENVVVHGKVEGGAAASFIGYGNGATKPQEFKFVNCYSDATIVALNEVATGFIAHPYCADGSSIVIQDSKFEGVMYNLASQPTRYFTGNNSGNISVTTIYSSGYSVANLYTNAPTTAGTTVYPKEDDHLGISYTKSANTLNKNTLAKPEIGEIFSVTKEDGATMAKAIFTISPHDTNNTGAYRSVYLSENCELDGTGTVFKTNQIRYFYITINGNATPSTGISDNTFNVVNSYYGTNHAGAFVTIVQYDANGSILMISEVQIAEKTI